MKLNDKLMLGFQESQYFLHVKLRNYRQEKLRIDDLHVLYKTETQSKYTMLDCRCYGQHSHENKSRAEIRQEPFIRAVFILDYTCSYKWYSSRLIFCV